MSSLVLEWRCGGDGRGNSGRGDAGYKAGSRFIGAHVIHLGDPRARFFYGYRIEIGQTGNFDYDRNEYQTLGAALLAAEILRTAHLVPRRAEGQIQVGRPVNHFEDLVG